MMILFVFYVGILFNTYPYVHKVFKIRTHLNILKIIIIGFTFSNEIQESINLKKFCFQYNLYNLEWNS